MKIKTKKIISIILSIVMLVPMISVDSKIYAQTTTSTAPTSAIKHKIEVLNGTAKNEKSEVISESEKDKTITLIANTKNGYTFSKWTVNAGDVKLLDINKSTTTFTMTDKDVKITGEYNKNSTVDNNSVRIYNSRRNYWNVANYTNVNDFIRKVDDIYLKQREIRPSSYFKNDLYYQDNSELYQQIARLFPADFSPNKKTWPTKSAFTEAKRQFASALAIKIEAKRKYMPEDYFSKATINTLLLRYFPEIYKDSMTYTEKLQNFLYHFGIVDSYYNYYLNIKLNNTTIDTFLQDMAEPMYYMLEFYEKRVFNETMLNRLRTQEAIDVKIKVETKTEAMDNAYYADRNRKIMEEMEDRNK